LLTESEGREASGLPALYFFLPDPITGRILEKLSQLVVYFTCDLSLWDGVTTTSVLNIGTR